jgi:hypothetical protein
MATTLNSATLAPPNGYTINDTYIGTAALLANGTLGRDLVVSGTKMKITLSWTALSTSELSTIRTQYANAVAAAVTFVGPDGTSCSVHAGQQAQISTEAYKAAGGLRWRCSIELWEA